MAFRAPAPLELALQTGKPPMVRASDAGDAARWVAARRDALRAAVAEHGALLVRGLALRDAARCEAVFWRLGELVTEMEAYAPRRSYATGVYSATKWPPHQPMCMHHELSYRLAFPGLMMFACLVAPARGGATLMADASAVLRALPAELVERFERLGWMLVRTYNEDIGASVAAAFGTDDRRAIERYCRATAIELTWRPDGTQCTRQRRSAIVRNSRSGQLCWFNQIAFLNAWTMDPEVREYLVDLHGEDGLPFDTRFGNGERIGADIVQVINGAYDACTVREAWQAGDLLLVDNVGTAHGREPFEGSRELVVAMADPLVMT